jgi:hypothetical protein
MKFSKEVERAILDGFIGRLPEKRLICPLCKHEQWVLTNGFIIVPIQRESEVFDTSGGAGLILAALSCTTCGNTHLLNLTSFPEVVRLMKQAVIYDDIEVKF